MRRLLTRVSVLSMLLTAPLLVGCGSGSNKTEIPTTFAPPQTGEPQSEGGARKGKPSGDVAAPPKK